MQIAFGIDKDTVQHNTPLKLIQRYNSLCRVSTSVPFETVCVHPKTLPESIMFFPFFFLFWFSFGFCFQAMSSSSLLDKLALPSKLTITYFYSHNVIWIRFFWPNNNNWIRWRGVLFLGVQLSYKTFSSSSENWEETPGVETNPPPGPSPQVWLLHRSCK